MDKIERAKHLLTDEFFTDVVKKQRELYIDTILNSDPDRMDEREAAYIKIRALDEFIASLESIAASAEVVKKRWKVF